MKIRIKKTNRKVPVSYHTINLKAYMYGLKDSEPISVYDNLKYHIKKVIRRAF